MKIRFDQVFTAETLCFFASIMESWDDDPKFDMRAALIPLGMMDSKIRDLHE